jgi:hypothetical protein
MGLGGLYCLLLQTRVLDVKRYSGRLAPTRALKEQIVKRHKVEACSSFCKFKSRV